mmetsp:Transcript_123975/g.309868  ORF Transcript_123975/g.309868 Transcript_123975/m.309868 type:complete len:257 (-) Transcript_123975:146-916(-)
MGASESGMAGGGGGSAGGSRDAGLFGSSAFCCGSNTGALPCCEKNSGTRNDIVGARPMHYPQTDPYAPGGGLDMHLGGPDKSGGAFNGGSAMGECSSMCKNLPGDDCMDSEETYEDGSMYKGQLRDGRRHGNGVWTSASEQYTGKWKDDQRDGQGKQTWSDGRIYEGRFSNGKFHGHGRMEWHMPTGLMVYEGQYVDDLKEGQGRYLWPDKRVYDGGWKKGVRHGHATYTNSQGVRRQGIWKEDKVERWLDGNGRG